MIRRTFSSGERTALYLAEDGKCAQCGRLLEKGFHADHVKPWSRGGVTDVINGQALCPQCNLRKGASMSTELREWQKNAFDKFSYHEGPNFLLEATPGAGKTRFAAEAALRLYDAGLIQRVIWVVPTARLRKQTADAVRIETGMQLKYDFANGDGAFPSGEFVGTTVTYQTIASEPALWRAHCSRVPTFVVLDEVHHASVMQTWGSALQSAFEPAVKRLLLSGTPFRSDNGAIPFVRYVDGRGQTDVSFGYGEALRSDVVRAVYFPKVGSRTQWLDDDGRHTATFDEKLDEAGQSRRLRAALMPEGGHLKGLLQQAHRDLLTMREEDFDAAGLVIAMDQEHARDIASLMKAEFGVTPVVAVTDEPDASAVIEAFSTSADTWIIAVKMVSEGVDIPRLRVGVYATNIVTELFFRQAVGRIVRRDEFGFASFFIPADERLIGYANNIRNQVETALEEKIRDDAAGEQDERGPSNTIFIPLASTATNEGVIAGEHSLSPAEIARADHVKLANRETAAISSIHVALLLRSAGAAMHFGSSDQRDSPPDLTARLKELRTFNDRTAKTIGYRHAVDFKDVNIILNASVGIKGVRGCDDPGKLERRLNNAKEWLQTAQPPVPERSAARG